MQTSDLSDFKKPFLVFAGVFSDSVQKKLDRALQNSALVVLSYLSSHSDFSMATKRENARRTAYAKELLLQGMPTKDVVKALVENYGTARSTAYTLVERADDAIFAQPERSEG